MYKTIVIIHIFYVWYVLPLDSTWKTAVALHFHGLDTKKPATVAYKKWCRFTLFWLVKASSTFMWAMNNTPWLFRLYNRGIILSLLSTNISTKWLYPPMLITILSRDYFLSQEKKQDIHRGQYFMSQNQPPPQKTIIFQPNHPFCKTAKKPCEFPRTVSGFIPADLSPRVPTSTGSVKALQAYERHWSCGKALAELQKVLQSMLRSRPRKAGH